MLNLWGKAGNVFPFHLCGRRNLCAHMLVVYTLIYENVNQFSLEEERVREASTVTIFAISLKPRCSWQKSNIKRSICRWEGGVKNAKCLPFCASHLLCPLLCVSLFLFHKHLARVWRKNGMRNNKKSLIPQPRKGEIKSSVIFIASISIRNRIHTHTPTRGK
jgi:hypothetical protein